jgi:hypothetical protein
MKLKTLLLSLIIAIACLNNVKALILTWDLTYDTHNFWSDKTNVLNMASDVFSGVSMQRDAIVHSGSNRSTISIWNPSNMNSLTHIYNRNIQQNEIVIFLGAQTMDYLGLGGPSGYSSSGTSQFTSIFNSINNNSGFRPIAGSVSASLSHNWHTSTSDIIPNDKIDLFSLTLHEVGHVLGLGITSANTWMNNIENEYWTGANANSAFGGSIQLDTDLAHWKWRTTNKQGQDLVMNKYLASGTRNTWTNAEFAVLQDMGYSVVPEPSVYFLLVFSCAFLIIAKIRRKNSAA